MLNIISSEETAEIIVTVGELKAHVRCNTGIDEDDEIASYILAAQEYVEGETGLTLTETQYEEFRYNFHPGRLILTALPVVSVQSVEYHNGTEYITIDEDDYIVMLSKKLGSYIVPKSHWPSPAMRPDAVRIVYTCGFEIVPERARQAVRLLAGGWYMSREAWASGSVPTEIAVALERLCYQLRDSRY
jgi:uncharacterized phiE125 gp8 family phage protein